METEKTKKLRVPSPKRGVLGSVHVVTALPANLKESVLSALKDPESVPRTMSGVSSLGFPRRFTVWHPGTVTLCGTYGELGVQVRVDEDAYAVEQVTVEKDDYDFAVVELKRGHELYVSDEEAVARLDEMKQTLKPRKRKSEFERLLAKNSGLLKDIAVSGE